MAYMFIFRMISDHLNNLGDAGDRRGLMVRSSTIKTPSVMLLVVVVGLFLSACAETQFLVHTAKRVGQDENVSKGRYKVGNPYQIGGIWYYPHVDYEYDETGIASWYGPNFHGKKTANGEIFDMNELTAAHRTLPLPSLVEVTNLENGRKLRLKVNDRGPFAKGRIIDISRQGAQLLGFRINGTAKVRVKILAAESRQLAAAAQGEGLLTESGSPITVEKLPVTDVASETLAPPPGAQVAEAPTEIVSDVIAEPLESSTVSSLSPTPEPQVSQVPVVDTGIYVQAGAFSQFNNANRARAVLSPIGDVNISSVLVNGIDLFRVRIGPVANVAEADMLLEQMIGVGYSDARIIVDNM